MSDGLPTEDAGLVRAREAALRFLAYRPRSEAEVRRRLLDRFPELLVERVVQRGHWLPQKYARGSYTCYRPGQFTTIAGLESQAAGALKFAGEHTDSFYSWQGYMEGACLSGIAAADAVVADIHAGQI